jgi:hypothetical protein
MEANMKNINSLITIFVFTMTLVSIAHAITLQEAKSEGFVGEQRDGYVGIVNNSASAEIQTLLNDVNSQRRQRYQQIAQQNGLSVDQVAALAYERAVEATQAGHFFQNASGSWVRK